MVFGISTVVYPATQQASTCTLAPECDHIFSVDYRAYRYRNVEQICRTKFSVDLPSTQKKVDVVGHTCLYPVLAKALIRWLQGSPRSMSLKRGQSHPGSIQVAVLLKQVQHDVPLTHFQLPYWYVGRPPVLYVSIRLSIYLSIYTHTYVYLYI